MTKEYNVKWRDERKERLAGELRELAEPLQKWLLANYDPMCKIMVEAGFTEVVRNETGASFLVDDAPPYRGSGAEGS